MVTIIKKDMNPHEVKKILEIRKQKQEKDRELKLTKHFGSLKRGIDGLEYQKEIRNEWE
ncbi:MAG: hypothetical protein ACERKD_23725 [Prolixibacteraceae bacterium]